MPSDDVVKSCFKPASAVISKQKEVSFHDVEFLELNIVLGDNPACRAGAPVALGNTIERRNLYDIDMYENFICPLSEKSGNRGKLGLSVTERADL